MTWIILTLALSISTTADPAYSIERICMGNGIHAAVIKYNKQYYVITSRAPIVKSFMIAYLPNPEHGGPRLMEYKNGRGQQTMSVNVLSRQVYKYSGFYGARSVCRQVTQR
ncbi:hypothetical protein [Aliifodinibius sp. S!AR15-10]|uniref:hypothetical protein n=1 Tax=Aliifodinibius sp. S!AR15-10 TaxID=2950437 RepID=UPI00286FC396|nr:hypothetical protein [Aliifodinibius sp. S!AR15-10]